MSNAKSPTLMSENINTGVDNTLVVDHTSRKSQLISVEELCLIDDFRFRVVDDEKTIAEYEEIYSQHRQDLVQNESARCPLGTLRVLCEDGKYFVVAGRLRLLAAQKAGLKTLPCVVTTNRKEAIRIGLESNKHGLPLNQWDRINCIQMAIVQNLGWSNRKIALAIGCSAGTVDSIVDKYELRKTTQLVRGKDGKMYRVRKPNSSESAVKQSSEGKPNTRLSKAGRPFDKVKTVLKPFMDNGQCVDVYVDLVKVIAAEGFTDDEHRQKFLQCLQTELFGQSVA